MRDDEESRKRRQNLEVEGRESRFYDSTFDDARPEFSLHSPGHRGKSSPTPAEVAPPFRAAPAGLKPGATQTRTFPRSLHTLRSFYGVISNTVLRDACPAEESPLRVNLGNYR